MASFTAGTTFSDGVANDVTAAKLGALVTNATPTSGLIQDRTAETVIASNDTVLIGDASDSNNLKRITVDNLMKADMTGNINSTTGTIATFNSTTGTIPTLVATTLITTGTGTATAPAISPTGDSNNGLFFPAADTIAATTNGTERLRIDSSGRVGIGDTNPIVKLQIRNDGITGANNYLQLITSSDSGKGVWQGIDVTNRLFYFKKNDSNDYAYDWQMADGTSYLRIDSSGNVNIGTSSTYSQYAKLNVLNGIAVATSSTEGGVYSGWTSNGTEISYLSLGKSYNLANVGETVLSTSAAKPLIFGTNNTERLRITSGGFFKASVSGSYQATASYHEIGTNNSGNYIIYFAHTGTTPYGIYQNWTNDPNNLTSTFLECRGNSTARMVIYSNGNIQNTNNSYGAISDAKLKENIIDASSQWNDVKSLQVRKFSFKDDQEHKLMLGLVAQEVELVSPNLVETINDKDSEGNDLGTTTKGVKYSILYMKAVKALQEAMERIEQLESKVAALEAA